MSEQRNARLTAIVAELDRIGNTVGMNRKRLDLRAERDGLLDQMLAERAAVVEALVNESALEGVP
jgi:hypothetical protein